MSIIGQGVVRAIYNPHLPVHIGLDLQWEKFEEICNSIVPDSNVYDSARLLKLDMLGRKAQIYQ